MFFLYYKTEKRVLQEWNENIVPNLKKDKKIIISAHGNTLRALVRYLDNISSFVVNNKYDLGLAYDGDGDRCLAVDENGDVKSATVSGKTITSDAGALEAAKRAAWQAKFTPGEGMVKGTITYKFIMK